MGREIELNPRRKFHDRVGNKIKEIREKSGIEISELSKESELSEAVLKSIERGKRDICLNGAAARKVCIGDKVIIVAYATYNQEELKSYKPTVVLVDENNDVSEILENL